MSNVVLLAPTGVGRITLIDGTAATTGSDGTITVDSKYLPDLLKAGYSMLPLQGAYSARPVTPPTGTLYFDTTMDQLLRYDASAAVWQVVRESDLLWSEDFLGCPASFATAGTTSIASTMVAKIVGTAPPPRPGPAEPVVSPRSP